MALDIQAEIAQVRRYYEQDEKQQGFNLLLLGEYVSGKTPILLTARKPIFIASFAPKGTVGLKKWIKRGEVIADTRYEDDDPFDPKAYKNWKSDFKRQYASDFFSHMGTYCIDSSTTFTAAAQAFKMDEKGRAGYTPEMRKDYNPAKIEIQNYLRKCLNLPCDFILTGHLRPIDKLISIDSKTGIERRETRFRYHAIGQAATFIPLLFSEIYVVTNKETSQGIDKKLLINSVGEYIARSKLSSDGLLDSVEDPDIKNILKKVGLPSGDKPLIKN